MFSWICPQCGRDVPPSKTECPFCAENQKHLAAMQAPPPAIGQPAPIEARQAPIAAEKQEPQRIAEQPTPAPAYQQPDAQRPDYPQPQYQPPQYQQPQYQQPDAWRGQQQYPPQYAQQQHPQYAPPSQQPYPPQAYAPGPHTPQGQHPWPPPQKKSLPTWALMLCIAAGILAVGAAVYYGTQTFGKTNPQERAGVENPANPSKAKVSNPLQKYVEVVGIRLMGDSKKKPIAKFIVVNHSSTEIDGLAATVTLWASTARSEEDSVASFAFQLPRLGAGESRELTQPVKTKLKLYELPDWQNANADVQITAP